MPSSRLSCEVKDEEVEAAAAEKAAETAAETAAAAASSLAKRGKSSFLWSLIAQSEVQGHHARSL